LSVAQVQRISTCIVDALQDYSVDERGDIGSWVRIEALKSIMQLVHVASKQRASHAEAVKQVFGTRHVSHVMLGRVLKQAVERIDSVRTVAVECLAVLLHDEQSLLLALPRPIIAIRDKLYQQPREALDVQSRPSPEPTAHLEGLENFQAMTQWLTVDSLRLEVLQGFAMSINAMTKSISEQATLALVAFIEAHAHNTNLLRDVLYDVVQLCQQTLQRTDKVASASITCALLQTLAVLINHTWQLLMTVDERWNAVCGVASKALAHAAGDIAKTMRTIELLCAIVAHTSATHAFTQAMQSICKLLQHPYPLVCQELHHQYSPQPTNQPTN
jgi:tubulin-specific chaperone D